MQNCVFCINGGKLVCSVNTLVGIYHCPAYVSIGVCETDRIVPCLSGLLPSRDSAYAVPFVCDGVDSNIVTFGTQPDRQELFPQLLDQLVELVGRADRFSHLEHRAIDHRCRTVRLPGAGGQDAFGAERETCRVGRPGEDQIAR